MTSEAELQRRRAHFLEHGPTLVPCIACGAEAWGINPLGWYCYDCGHQVAPDGGEADEFDVLNYPARGNG